MTRVADWPALILAAGLGTRLGPLSSLRAKAALPVAGRPLIDRILAHLAEAGVTRVVINLHHRADTLTRVVGDGDAWGLQVRYSWEPEVLGSAGGPARALPLLASDRFFVVNGDTLSAVRLPELMRAHLESGAQVTLAAGPADLSRYNAVLADVTGAFTGIAARGAALAADDGQSAWHFVGVQAVNASAFAGVAPDRPADSLRQVYAGLPAGAVRVFPYDGVFHDIGTPRDYLHTARTLAMQEGLPLDRGCDTRVDMGAHVEDSVLWDRVRVHEGAHVRHCIVTDDVVIADGARYDSAVVTATGVHAL